MFNADESVQEGSISFIDFGDSSYVSDSLGAELNVSSRRGYIKFTNITRITTIPNEFKLNQNYPNPFNPITTISYDLPQASDVKLNVYDITGRLIQTLVDKKQSTEQYSVRFNASQYSSSVYFYRFQTDDFVQTKKMLLIK